MADQEQRMTPPQFAMVIQDAADGTIELGGGFHPAEFLPTSLAHQVGWFIQNNLQDLVQTAHAEFTRHQRLNSTAPVAEQKIILPANLAGDVA